MNIMKSLTSAGCSDGFPYPLEMARS